MMESTDRSSLRETTVLAIGLGIVVGLVMTVANVYLGMFAGMTINASIPAAVVGMGILRGVLRRGTVLENNIVQTIASAGESLAAGIIFTMPALLLAGVWTGFDYWTTTLVAMTGGLLGVLFMIPLRKPMIIEGEGLIYPEGVACSKVLLAGESGGAGMKQVFGALGIGALVKILSEGTGVLAAHIHGSLATLGTRFFGSITASPALVGVGYIVGIRIAVLVFLGGAISWLVAAPWLVDNRDYGMGLTDPGLLGAVKNDVRFLGVGGMVVGGLWSILQIRKGIVAGIRETLSGYKASMGQGVAVEREQQDMNPRWLLLLISGTIITVLALYLKVCKDPGVAALATVLMTVCAFFFVAVAAYIVGLVGASNSPVSGMTICTVLLTSLFISLAGFSGEVAILATMGVAGVVCCAACTSGDVCQDLKTGSLVGATPFRQQWVEVLGVISAAFVLAPVLGLLHEVYGIGSESLPAPQAALFASLMQGFFGDAILPWDLVAAGAVVGLAIVLVDQLLLGPRGSSFRLHVMPVAVGMYLPFGLSTAILLGGLFAWLSSKRGGEASHERGILLASGLVAGEAIAGVLIALALVLLAEGDTDALPDWAGAWSSPMAFAMLAGMGWLLAGKVRRRGQSG